MNLNELNFYYKYDNGSLPKYFQKRQEHDLNSIRTENQFIQNYQIHQYNTRNRNNMHILKTNHKFADKCLRQNTPYFINSTPVCILNKMYTHSIQSFTKSVKLLYINEYSDTCSTVNCYISAIKTELMHTRLILTQTPRHSQYDRPDKHSGI